MIEREFKDLVSNLELENIIKKEYNLLIKSIIDAVSENINKNLKVNDIKVTDEPIKDEKEYLINLVVSLKNKVLPFELLQLSIMNEIENCILFNLKNNLLFKENNDLSNLITRDYLNNLIIFNLDTIKVIINIYYNKSSILNINVIPEDKSFYDYHENIEFNYFNYLNKEYNRFNKTIRIIKSFCLENKDNIINNKVLKYLLAYSLNKYNNNSNNDYDNSYIGYLNALSKGLKDFLDGLVINPSEEEYIKFEVFGTIKPSNRFNIISINNKSNNIIKDLIDNTSLIKQIKDLRTKIVMSLPKEGKFVLINITPNFVSVGKTIEWSFSIEGTNVCNNGGEYDYNEDNYYMCCYRAMLKGLQYVSKNKLGNNIIIKCATIEPFKSGNLSYENESRFANILAFIKDNDLMIDYKLDE